MKTSPRSNLTMLEEPTRFDTQYPPIYGLSFFLFIFFLYKWNRHSSSTRKNLPPSPPWIPIIGHLHLLGEYPHRSLRSLSQRYGDIMLLYLGSKPTVIVSSAEVARQVLRTHDSVFSSRPDSRFRALSYDGKDIASAPYGEYWRHLRSICTLNLLSAKMVRSFQNVRVEETTLLMERIKGKMKAEEPALVNLSELINVSTNDAVCRVALGRKYRRDGDASGEARNWNKFLKEYIGLLGNLYIGDFVPALSWVNYMNGVNRKSARIMRDIDKLMEEIIDGHMGGGKSNGNDDDNNEKKKMKDLVDVLLEVQKDSNLLGKKSIKGILLDMFTAGTDTTYCAVEWAMVELLRHPKAMQKLQSEIRETSGHQGRLITEEDIINMKYLKAVIKETLRLHPPGAMLLPHESVQDAEINGWFVPARTQVIVNAWAIQRDPASWDQPEEFQPERFLDSPVDYKGQDFQFIPFGAGRRGCPGTTFAIAIVELLLANLIGNFNWKVPNDEAPNMTESFGAVVSRKLPLLVFATPH